MERRPRLLHGMKRYLTSPDNIASNAVSVGVAMGWGRKVTWPIVQHRWMIGLYGGHVLVSCKFPFFVDVLANYITISLLIGIEVPDDEYDSPANGRTSRHPSAPTSEFESPEDSDVVMEIDGNGKTGRSFPNDPDFRNKALMSASVRTCNDMNADGFFNDVDIQAIDEPNKQREDKTRDVTAFFSTAHTTKTVTRKVCHVRDCEICWYNMLFQSHVS